MPKTPSGTWIARGLLVGMLAAAVGGLVVSFREPFYHFRIVDPGRVYRAGTLDAGSLGEVIDRFGVKTLLNLRSVEERSDGRWYDEERRVAAAKGVRLVDVPIPPGTPPTPEQVREILAVFDEAGRSPVLLHCEHGVTRSAAAEALYRREYFHETPEEALARTAVFGRNLDEKYPAIAAFVRQYVPRGAGGSGR